MRKEKGILMERKRKFLSAGMKRNFSAIQRKLVSPRIDSPLYLYYWFCQKLEKEERYNDDDGNYPIVTDNSKG